MFIAMKKYSLEEMSDGYANISVSVADSGVGIDDDKLDLIFNKFDQEKWH